jgi:hypothetical protein
MTDISNHCKHQRNEMKSISLPDLDIVRNTNGDVIKLELNRLSTLGSSNGLVVICRRLVVQDSSKHHECQIRLADINLQAERSRTRQLHVTTEARDTNVVLILDGPATVEDGSNVTVDNRLSRGKEGLKDKGSSVSLDIKGDATETGLGTIFARMEGQERVADDSIGVARLVQVEVQLVAVDELPIGYQLGCKYEYTELYSPFIIEREVLVLEGNIRSNHRLLSDHVVIKLHNC